MTKLDINTNLLDNPHVLGQGSGNYVNFVGKRNNKVFLVRKDSDLLNFDKLGDEVMSNAVGVTSTTLTPISEIQPTTTTTKPTTTTTVSEVPTLSTPVQAPTATATATPTTTSTPISTAPQIIPSTSTVTTSTPRTFGSLGQVAVIPHTSFAPKPSITTVAQEIPQAPIVTPIIAVPLQSMTPMAIAPAPVFGGGGGGGGMMPESGEEAARETAKTSGGSVEKKVLGMKPVYGYSILGLAALVISVYAYKKYVK